jgi:hypothetical protein
MSNRAFASFWTRNYSEDVMLERFEHFLETLPLTSKESIFLSLTERAISPGETPLDEHDLRGMSAKPADIVALAREHLSADCAYEVEASWPLWSWDAEHSRWGRQPERLLLTCHGQEYDDGAAQTSGHFLIDAGLEHLYTGHGGLLGAHVSSPATADPTESNFLALMSEQQNLREYHQKTRENIQQLMNWVQNVERALPIERLALWSEGEENLEARLDDILAVR